MKYPPWKESQFTRIWDMTERLRALPNKGMDHPEDDACLRVWWLHAPWMSGPLVPWQWHYIALVHLRDLPGQSQPPFHKFPGSTHELIAYAMDPGYPVDPQIDPIPDGHFLSPVSIVQQFTAETDAKALDMVERCLDLCVAGRLSVESDGRRAWEHLLTECTHINEHLGRAS